METLGGQIKTVDPSSGNIDSDDGCGWVFADGLGTVVAGPLPSTTEGLTSDYRSNSLVTAGGGQPTVRELPAVEGYPAVQSTLGYDGDGSCILIVGLSNTQVYGVKTGLGPRHPYYKDACGLASKVAAFAIQYLKTQ